MPTYAETETSVQDGEPVEIYTFTAGSTVYRYTSHPEDVTVSSQVYTSTTIARANASAAPLGQVREMFVTVAVSHPLTDVLINGGVPLREVPVRIERYHPGTSLRTLHHGYVSDVEIDGDTARIRVPNSTDDQFTVRLPFATLGRVCNHELYDRGCAVDRDYPVYVTEPFMTACEVSSVSGTTLVVSNMDDPGAVARPDQWARYGEVRRVTDGERRDILAQVGTTLTLNVPFAVLAPGDDLEVYAGCDHTVETCVSKFANAINFGNDVDLPNNNPHAPTGYGVIVSG